MLFRTEANKENNSESPKMNRSTITKIFKVTVNILIIYLFSRFPIIFLIVLLFQEVVHCFLGDGSLLT